MFLHGFGTNPRIWKEFSEGEKPQLEFSGLFQKAEEIGQGQGKGIVIGWSMGGMLALLLAAKFPDKVKELVLISTTPRFLGAPCGISPAVLHKLRKQIRKEGISAFHKLITEDLSHPGLENISIERAERELDELAGMDLCDLLPLIEAPTLIIHGDKDAICLPAAAEYLHSKIKNSKLVILPGTGHAPMLEAPELLKGLSYAGNLFVPDHLSGRAGR